MNADVTVVIDFVTQVRSNCRVLVANPFHLEAGEALADLLEQTAPLAEEALLRIAQEGHTAVDLLLDAAERI